MRPDPAYPVTWFMRFIKACKSAGRGLARVLFGKLPPTWQLRLYDTLLASARALAPRLVKPGSKGEHLVRHRALEFRLPANCVDEILRMADTMDASLISRQDLQSTVFASPTFSAEALEGQRYFDVLKQLDACHASFVIGWQSLWLDVPESVRAAAAARNGDVLFISLAPLATATYGDGVQSVRIAGGAAHDSASVASCATLLATLIIQRAPSAVYVSRDGSLADSLQRYRNALSARSEIISF